MSETFHSNGSGGGHEPGRARLSAADAAAVDAVLGGEGERGRDEARERRLHEWLKVLAAAPVPEPSGNLLERTLMAVQADRMKLPAARPAQEREIDMTPHVRRRWSRRIAEFGAMAVAASILVAVVFVGLEQSRIASARTACAQNMTFLGKGFATYASNHEGRLPVLAMPSNHRWMQSTESGAARSNMSNLMPLVNDKYITLADLHCAGVTEPRQAARPDDVASDYSYAHVYGAARPRWGSRALVVLADRNPLFVTEVIPTTVTPAQTERNSPNHKGKGNYLLHGDGDVTWETTPNVGSDNIWTVNSGGQRVLAYTGTEAPASGADVFVCP